MLSITRILPQHLDLFKTIRLRALRESPSAYSSTYEHEVNLSDDEWLARIDRWNGQTGIGFLAMEGEVPCGIGGALLDPADNTRAELVSMWTEQTCRRHGVGSLIITAVIEWTRKQHIDVLSLIVTSTNGPAIRFYTQLGFAMTGRTEPYPNDPAITELEMSRPT